MMLRHRALRRWTYAAPFIVASVTACGTEPSGMEATPQTVADRVELTEAQIRSAGIVTLVPERTTLRQGVSVPASVQSPDTARSSVGSIVEGRVARILVVPGDVVGAGQTLVEIHAHELADVQRDLTTARAEESFRRNAFERSERLLEAGAVSVEEVERRRADLQVAVAEVRRAEEMLEHLHPSDDGDVRLVAPTAGTVFAVSARPGQAVLPGDPLVEMGATKVLWATAYLPEHTAAALVTGDRVEVRFNATQDVVGARLVRAGNYVDPANRSIEMRFELERVPPGVRPGSFAVVEVATSETSQGIELPAAAAVRLGAGDAVFVAEGGGRYRAVPVVVTPTREGRVGVEGLPDGAEVVVEGAYFLKAALELGSAAEGDAS